MFYRINVSSHSIESGPADLPSDLVGLAPDDLADLSVALNPCPRQWAGVGYWLGVPVTPSFDPARQRLSDQIDEVPDPATRTVIVTPLVVNLTPAEIASQEAARLSAARYAKVQAINAERDRRLEAGALYASKRIDVSDKGRADLGGMSIAALLAQAGTVPWSDGYAQGWISLDNSRVPLPTPAAGLALSTAVGDWYGRTIQHARDLKDAVLVSDDPATIAIEGGWPS